MSGHFGVTGTRQEPTPRQLVALMGLMAAHQPDNAILHHGDCIGVDRAAHYLAHSIGLRVIIHPPIEDRFRAFCSFPLEARNPDEYLRRDRLMLCSVDHLYALPHQTHEVRRGSGTWYCIRYARARKLPMTIIWPNGEMSWEE